MLATESYLSAKCAPAISSSHSVTRESGRTAITVSREMELPANLPDIARTVVGNTLRLTETQNWQDAAIDSTRSGSLQIIVIAGTAEINGTLSLRPNVTGSIMTVTADIMVKIPFFGASLERSIKGTVESVLRAEESIGQTWLAENV